MKGAEFRPRASFTVPPQLLLDPRETGRTSTARSAPTRLPHAVREFGHLPDFDLWRPGDALLFSSTRPGFMQRRIVRAQRRLGYAPEHARWHHAGIYLGDRYVCEAVPGGVRYRPVVEFVPDYLIRARRGRGLDGEQAFRVAMRAVMRLSKPYSHWRAIRAWLGSWNSGSLSPLDYRVRGHAVVCSQLFHDAYMEATGRTLVDRVDTTVLPAELSACEGLEDVPSAWSPLP